MNSKTVNSALLVSIFAASGVLLASPSHAGSCTGNLFGNANNWAACTSGWNTITTPGGAQYQIDLSTLSITGFNIEDMDTIDITPLTGNEFTVNYTFTPTLGSTMPNRPNSSGTLAYTVNILNGFYYTAAQNNITGSTLSGGSYTTSTTEAMSAFASLTSDSTNNPSIVSPIVPGKTSLNITQTFSHVDPATITAFGSNFTSQVPGPLPIAGAGMAFGLSRHIRRRIRQAA